MPYKSTFSMKCLYCSYDETQVIDTRDTENLEATRRRRECLKCQKRFTTYERVEEADIIVVKKGGKRERFERQKLLNGILKACEKREISLEKVEKLADAVESDLRKRDSVEVDSRVIGQITMKRLKSLDKVAYIRFASVYQEFEDLERFEEELGKLQKK
jgi:transcriptional repressor NrdR